jgi:hypothetical protein
MGNCYFDPKILFLNPGIEPWPFGGLIVGKNLSYSSKSEYSMNKQQTIVGK